MPIPLLGYIHFASYFIPAAVALYRFRSLQKPFRILAVLTVIACFNVTSLFVLGQLGINNSFQINFYVLLEFVLVGWIFQQAAGSATLRRFFTTLLLLFPIIWIFDKVFIEIPDEMNTEMALLSRLFLVVMAVFVIAPEQRDLYARMVDKAIFWTAAAVILYSSGTFLVFGLGNVLLKEDVSQFVLIWHINWALLIVANLLYTKAILSRS